MRIRRLEIHDLRSFRGKRVLDFTDPVTGEARDRVVLVGSNGSGKTTVFDVVEAMLRFVVDEAPPRILDEAGLVTLTMELGRDDPEPIDVAYGKLPEGDGWEPFGPRVFEEGEFRPCAYTRGSSFEKLVLELALLVQGKADLSGGLIYFPHDRELRPVRGGTIEPPPDDRQWISRYSPANQWTGSLEQLWVWQNYLDLERSSRGEPTGELASSVELLQAVLGPGRQVVVREGRVRVSTPWNDASGKPAAVLLDQLPSGERQCVMLFGEITRRKRPHGVLFIDEPEISLHPTLQRQTLAQLRRFARKLDMQVFLATHSREIVRSVPPGEVMSLDYPESRFDAPVDEEPS
ncbi:AAA family ATPase [Polyangium spumosum]|nr:ATP-binding protein [Polyangium spumosum]